MKFTKLTERNGYSVNTGDGRLVEVWYDRSLRLWTAFRVDEEGNQISDAIYDISKELATEWAGHHHTYE